MSAQIDIIEAFAEDESIIFDVTFRDRNGVAIADADSEVTEASIAICSDETKTTLVTSIKLSAGEVTLTDTATARFQFEIPAGKAGQLSPKTDYFYDIWSVSTNEGRMRQAHGVFRLDYGEAEA